MAAVSSIIAAAALTVGVASAYQQRQSAKEQRRAMQQAAYEEKKVRAVSAAQNTFRQAQEQRQQIREERVRRAQIMQASENAGVSGSSGAMGAVGALSTNLNSNVGFNRSSAAAGQLITGFSQNAADYNTTASKWGFRAQTAGSISGLGMNIFQSAGGFGTLFGMGTSQPTAMAAPTVDRWAGATGAVY